MAPINDSRTIMMMGVIIIIMGVVIGLTVFDYIVTKGELDNCNVSQHPYASMGRCPNGFYPIRKRSDGKCERYI